MQKLIVVVALSLCACASSQKNILGDSEMAKKFAPIAFLVGDWDGSGSAPGAAAAPAATATPADGQPAQPAPQSVGSFSIGPDLSTHVLTRRAFNMSGTQLHEDLTIIYLQGADMRADYWDNEGHTIRYQVYPQPQAKQVVFESNPLPDGAQFRLTYHSIDDDTLELKFDIGHAGGEYQPYVAGVLKRRKK